MDNFNQWLQNNSNGPYADWPQELKDEIARVVDANNKGAEISQDAFVTRMKAVYGVSCTTRKLTQYVQRTHKQNWRNSTKAVRKRAQAEKVIPRAAQPDDVIAWLKMNQGSTRNEIADGLKTSKEGVRYALDYCRDRGQVFSTGKGPGTRYYYRDPEVLRRHGYK